MDDIPPSVAIVFMICVAIITTTIIVCDCVKYAAPDNAATSTETTSALTDKPTLTEEQARRAGCALMMRTATHAATGF